MSRFVSRLVLWISLCCPALCLAQSEGESTAQSVAKMLPSLWTAMEMDNKCNALSAREKQALRDSISVMARSINLDEETLRKRMAETDPVGRLSCGGELAGHLLGLAKNVSKTWIARTSPQEDPKPGSWAHAQQSWAQIFNEKPRGRLGIFEGCWSGNVASHATEVCFLERGDRIKFRLGSPSALSCSFKDGGARENGDMRCSLRLRGSRAVATDPEFSTSKGDASRSVTARLSASSPSFRWTTASTRPGQAAQSLALCV